MTTFIPGWYVVQTKPAREKRAEAALMEMGFDAYLPRETRWVTHARQRSRAHYAVFPRYLFVNVPGGELGLHMVRRADCVERILRAGLEARPISARWVEALRDKEAGGAFDRTQKAVREKFKPGTMVRFTEEAGGFEGLLAKVIGSEPGDRVRLLFEIFGSEREISVPNREVKAQDVAA